jgi:hypothetical protein
MGVLPARASPRPIRSRLGLLVAAAGGVLELVGLISDAIQHRLDPGLAAREDLFSLGNASHGLLIVGIGLAVVGIAYELIFGEVAVALGGAAARAIGVMLVALLAANGGILLVSGSLAPSDQHHQGSAAEANDPLTLQLEATVRSKGLAAALDELTAIAATDPAVMRRGHDIAHALGEFATGFYGGPQQALRQCKDNFLYGCYHGALRGYFESRGQTKPSDVVGICQAELGRLLYFQCLHGLGHGVLANLGNDMFRALTYCDALRDDFERQSCYGGVFMENVVLAIDQVNGRAEGERAAARPYLRADDPLYPCDVIAERYRSSCYLLQTSGMLLYNGRDFGKTAAACDAAPAAHVVTCFESIGRDVSGDTLRDDAKTIAVCAGLPSKNRDHCYAGAVKNLLDAIDREIPFCRQVPTSGKAICYAAVGQQFAFVYPKVEDRSQACATGELEYRRDCEEAAKR